MKKAVIIGIVFAALAVGIIFFVFLQIKDIKKDQDLTLQLSPALLEQLRGKHISDFPYQPDPIQWDGKYFAVDDGAASALIEAHIAFTYNKKLNEMLNTDSFFPGNDIKGIVWIVSNMKEVGQYENGSKAWQNYNILSYLDLAQKTVLARDTLWGDMPPKYTRNSGGDYGKKPDENTIVKSIQSRINNQ